VRNSAGSVVNAFGLGLGADFCLVRSRLARGNFGLRQSLSQLSGALFCSFGSSYLLCFLLNLGILQVLFNQVLS
jgi:hypothetical protein